METSGPTSGIPRVLTATTQATTGQWQVGQLLQATVTGNSGGKVLLAIGNRQVSAETSLPLEKGQHLTLQVRSLGEQPVLRISARPGAAPLAETIRMLLPRQGSLTPLLAGMAELARSPNPQLPQLLNRLIRSMIRQLPDARTVGSPEGLGKAIKNSGIFLERQLLMDAAYRPDTLPSALQSDFKANLLRLLQLVRHWPGSSAQGSGTARSGSAAGTSPPVMPPATGQAPVTGSAAAGAGSPVASGKGSAAATGNTPPATAKQLGRVLQTPPLPTGRSATGAGTGTGSAAPTTAAAGSSAPAAPPPLRGSVPVPQSATQVSLDLLNRMGNFRTDLLQQAEAALARVQLQQLAALPREGERGLLEWLFELPARRGDAIDLWSLRVFREAEEQQRQNQSREQSWSVQLAFDLPGLGPMQAQVRLSGETVSTRFWADSPRTLPLLREHLPELGQALDAAGLSVGELDCQPGPMPAARTGGGEPLINAKA